MVIKMNICKQFGNNVKKIRNDLGISQEKLAELTNLHRTYISDIERGKRNVSLKNIYKLARALSVKEKDLFNWNQNNQGG
jgi:transcriptional regulator with XRE-family HTH domain